jgi:hypothetical protein
MTNAKEKWAQEHLASKKNFEKKQQDKMTNWLAIREDEKRTEELKIGRSVVRRQERRTG